MRRDRAERRAREYQANNDEPNVVYFAYHYGRNSWGVRKRTVIKGTYGHPEDVER
jgi:hypothetical protein